MIQTKDDLINKVVKATGGSYNIISRYPQEMLEQWLANLNLYSDSSEEHEWIDESMEEEEKLANDENYALEP